MNIAHFITTAGLYGAERWVLSFLTHAVNHADHRFVLICTSSDNQELIEIARKRKIKCYVLETKHNFDIQKAVQHLNRFLQQEQIHVLHSHGYKSDIIGYLACRSSNTKILSTPHGWDLQAGIKVRIYNWLDRRVLQYFDKVVPLSQPLADTLSMVSSKRLSVINNHIDLNELPTPKAGDPFLISYIGRLTRLKRVADIIRALSRVDYRFRLQIIGEGPERLNLELLAQELGLLNRVSFLGYRTDRLDLLNQSRIFVLASTSEGTSRSMMEAMALGKVVLGSDIDGNRVLLKEDKTGFLFPVGSDIGLSQKIDKTIIEPDEANQVSQNASRLIHHYYSAQAVVIQYLELYSELHKTTKHTYNPKGTATSLRTRETNANDG